MTSELVRAASRLLTVGSDSHQLLRDLGALLVPARAQWCLVDRLEDPDLVTRVAALGVDGALELPAILGSPEARRSSAQTQGLLRQLFEAPQRVRRYSPAQLATLADAADPRLRAQAELAIEAGTTDLLVLGLSHRSTLLGVLTLGRVGGNFDDDSVHELADLAAIAGLALYASRLLTVQRSVSTALQTHLLPPLPAVPGLTLAARYLPAGGGLDVGGDWYDAFLLPGGQVALVVGDATGHDVNAAVTMAELRSLLRAVAIDRQEPPAATLVRLDQVSGQLRAETSATCCYAQLRAEGEGRWRLQWSSAGHLPPLLVHDGVPRFLDTEPDLMLGVDPHTRRTDHAAALQTGDLLLLFTDGLVEDRRIALSDRLELLRTTVADVTHPTLEFLADHLIRTLPAGQDDVAVLAVLVGGPVMGGGRRGRGEASNLARCDTPS